jgi:uncharacterized protein (DUF983 family)
MKGVCPKCGKVYYGWALANPEVQRCGECGSVLVTQRDAAAPRAGSALMRAAMHDVLANRNLRESALTFNLPFYLHRN